MKTMKLAIALLVVAVAVSAAKSQPQPQRKTGGRTTPTGRSLTVFDYIEIKQLVSRYGYAVDTGADDGNMYADLFAPDGAFLDRTGKATTGREALAAVARRFRRGPQSQFHFLMNHVIEPTADGARGKEYLLQLRMGEPGHDNETSAAATTRTPTRRPPAVGDSRHASSFHPNCRPQGPRRARHRSMRSVRSMAATPRCPRCHWACCRRRLEPRRRPTP